MTIEQNILIKGVRDGLLVTVKPGKWAERKEEILDLIKVQSSFFNGARVCIDVGEIPLRVVDITNLRDRLSDQAVTLWAILAKSEQTINNVKALGLETRLQEKIEVKEQKSPEHENDPAIYINKTLRAGTKVESHYHVIVKGDVNPGAEVISAGNIVIWGKLAGSAIAGAEGNSSSIICALELNPTQLRIASFVFPPFSKKGKSFPAIASIENDEFKINLWNKDKG